MCDFILKGAETYWITDCMVPYAVSGNQWVGFDDEESLRVKVRGSKLVGIFYLDILVVFGSSFYDFGFNIVIDFQTSDTLI